VVDYGLGKDGPWFDARLIASLREEKSSLIAIDAPLTLPVGVRRTLAESPAERARDEQVLDWFARRAQAAKEKSAKPRYTPYTQRIAEVLLAEDHGLEPRETLGQGMGPLTARAVYLRRELAATHELDRNLIEVYPKATVARLFPSRVTKRYKRSAESPRVRLDMLNALGDLSFAPGAWKEHGLSNDHKFDALLCAYTAYLWSCGKCVEPPDDLARADGWIWVPKT
jgi:predicted nuclease with RNAse H fold